MNRLTPRAVLCLSADERNLFFTSRQQQELTELLPSATWIDPSCGTEEWQARLAATRPEIVLSSWRTPTLPDAMPGLRLVCHVGGSVRRLVPRHHLAAGLLVTNWGDAITETVAEAGLLLALSALRRSHHFAAVMHEGKGWESMPSKTGTLFDRRIGLHGFGAIARSLVQLLQPFRPRLAAYTPGAIDAAEYDRLGVQRVESLERLFADSEILFEVEALTPGSQGLVNAALLAQLPDGAVFVNIGRGALVDEAALAKEALSGRIRVALDVFAAEPLPVDSPLRRVPDAVLFPHLAGMPDDRCPACGQKALENLRRFLTGSPVLDRVSLETYDRST